MPDSMAILLGALLVAGQIVAPRGWDDVVLPRGFQFVPATAEVTNRAEGTGGGWLTYEAGVLSCRGEGLSLHPLPAPTKPAGSARDERIPDPKLVGPFAAPTLDAEAGERQVAPERGDAFLFREAAGGWGYLRVLENEPASIRLEWALGAAGPDPEALRREPERVRATDDEGAIRLEWDVLSAGATYRIVRRYHDGAGYRTATFTAEGSEFRDESPELEGRRLEYSVARVRDDGGTEFGSRAVGAAPLWDPDEPLVLRRGQLINLLSGETQQRLADLDVETVSSNGAQLAVARGSRLWNLSGPKSGTWVLPEGPTQGYESPRLYLQNGREAVCVSAEGLVARLAVETVEGEVRLRRWIDPRGGRLLPRAPRVIEWTSLPGGELRFELSQLTRELEDADGALLTPTLELESPFDSDTWIEVDRGAPGQFELLHPFAGELRAERFRLRYRLDDFVRSPPSTPVVVVVGDDRGPRAEAALVAALADLTSPEFTRRRTARRLIQALGARAWPALREGLASEDPELAATARELLDLAGAGAESDPESRDGDAATDLPFALRVVAEAERQGVTAPLPAELGDDPLLRALALLRLHGERQRAAETGAAGAAGPRALEPWLPVLAAADPDPGVRRVAEVVLQGREDPWLERAFWRHVDTGEELDEAFELPLEQQVEDWSRFFAESPSVLGSIRVLSEAIDLSRPRAAEVLLQSLWDLTLAQRLDEERQRAAMSRARLGLLLQAQSSIQDEPAFLSAAARLAPADDERVPGALRLRALRDLAHVGAASAPSTGALSLRLAEASLSALRTELEILAEEPPPNGVVLTLPPGRYFEEGGSNSGLLLGVDGLRLVGEGECVIEVGLRASDAQDLAIENLVVTTGSSTALSLYRASLRADRCTFRSANTIVQVNESTFAASNCELEPQGERPGSYGLRSTGSSLVLLDSSLVRGCATGVSITGSGYLERCVVTGGTRGALECPTGDGELYLLDVLVHADGAALGRLDRAGIDGLIVSSANSVNIGPRIVVCPERLHLLVDLPREPSGFVARCLLDE